MLPRNAILDVDIIFTCIPAIAVFLFKDLVAPDFTIDFPTLLVVLFGCFFYAAS